MKADKLKKRITIKEEKEIEGKTQKEITNI